MRACVGGWVCHALPCGHNSYYSFCPITFKLHMHIRHDERKNPIDFGSRDQISPRNRVGGDIVTRPFVGGWVSEWVRV